MIEISLINTANDIIEPLKWLHTIQNIIMVFTIGIVAKDNIEFILWNLFASTCPTLCYS